MPLNPRTVTPDKKTVPLARWRGLLREKTLSPAQRRDLIGKKTIPPVQRRGLMEKKTLPLAQRRDLFFQKTLPPTQRRPLFRQKTIPLAQRRDLFSQKTIPLTRRRPLFGQKTIPLAWRRSLFLPEFDLDTQKIVRRTPRRVFGNGSRDLAEENFARRVREIVCPQDQSDLADGGTPPRCQPALRERREIQRTGHYRW